MKETLYFIFAYKLVVKRYIYIRIDFITAFTLFSIFLPSIFARESSDLSIDTIKRDSRNLIRNLTYIGERQKDGN